MESVASLYASVQSTVIASLKREWQRYGWEDADIDDKADKLLSIWRHHLEASGALTVESVTQLQSMYQSEAASNNQSKKRGRPSIADKPDKRLKTGPLVQTPLSYPKLEMFQSMSQSMGQSQSIILTGAARYANGLPILTAIVPEMPETAPEMPETPETQSSDQSGSQPKDPSNESKEQPNSQSTSQLTNPSESSQSVPENQPVISVKAERIQARVQSTNHSNGTSDQPINTPPINDPLNQLAREPLSNLDDDSDLEMDVSNVKDVCIAQYEKIGQVKNAKNKWRVVLRDGIINVRGRDYVFSRATGELHW